MNIIKIEKTCEACPTQWQFETDDGRYGYIRYRWGCLKIYISQAGESLNEALKRKDESLIMWANLGDSLDGSLPDSKMKMALKLLGFKFIKEM